MRQGLLLIPLLYLLQAVAGIDGVIYGQSITDYITVAASAVLWGRMKGQLRKKI